MGRMVRIVAAVMAMVVLSTGAAFAAVLDGTAAGDALRGTNGADTIRGGGGGDILRGMDGDDKLYGDGGSDGLYGGAGNDHMYGGAGRRPAGGPLRVRRRWERPRLRWLRLGQPLLGPRQRLHFIRGRQGGRLRGLRRRPRHRQGGLRHEPGPLRRLRGVRQLAPSFRRSDGGARFSAPAFVCTGR